MGLVRFQIKGESAVLSVNVASRFRGEGWGRELILFSTRELVRSPCGAAGRRIRQAGESGVGSFVRSERVSEAGKRTHRRTRTLCFLPGSAGWELMPAEWLHSRLRDRRVGPGSPVYVIAELSANHNQDFDQAVRILRAAKDAGADAVKLQTYTADTITLRSDKECFRIAGRHAVGWSHSSRPLPGGVYALGVAAEA